MDCQEEVIIMPVDKVKGGYRVRSYVTGKMLKRVYKTRAAAQRRGCYFKEKVKEKEKHRIEKGKKEAVLMALIKWFGRGKAAEKRAKAFTASQRRIYTLNTRTSMRIGFRQFALKVLSKEPKRKKKKKSYREPHARALS